MKAGVGPDQQRRHQNAIAALSLGKRHLGLHLIEAAGDHRIVMCEAAGPGIGQPDLILDARHALLEGMEMLVDEAVIVLDDIKPAARITTAELRQFRGRKTQWLDRRRRQRPAINIQVLADAINAEARATESLQLLIRQLHVDDLDAAADRDVAEQHVQQIGNGVIGHIRAVADPHIIVGRRAQPFGDCLDDADDARLPMAGWHAVFRNLHRLLDADIFGMRSDRA